MIGPKTWDRIVGFFLRIFDFSVTVQKLVGCLCWNNALKCMLYMKKAGNGQFDRSQNMRPNCGIFFRHSWSVRGCWGLIWGVYMIIYGINYALVFIRPEMGMKFGSKK